MSNLLVFQCFVATENLIDMQYLLRPSCFALWCLENASKKFNLSDRITIIDPLNSEDCERGSNVFE